MTFFRLPAVLVFCALGSVRAQDRADSSGKTSGIDGRRTVTVEDEYVAVARLTGENNPENIDQQTFEQLSNWLSHPLPVNLSSRSKLLSSGLFTPYQVATLTDCRDRSGDILSLEELALIDGFSAETAAALAPFISLRSDSLSGRPRQSTESGKHYHSKNCTHKLQLRNSARMPDTGGCEVGYGIKYRLASPGGIEAGIGLNRGYTDKNYWPAGGTFFLAYYGRNHLGKLVVGDYNLRLGQGLAVWTGFTVSSISFPDSFYRRSFGISPCISYSTGSSLKGIAADFIFGKLTLALSLGLDGFDKALSRKLSGRDFPLNSLSLRPCANLAWSGRKVTASFTVAATSGTLDRAGDFSDVILSGDFRCCVRGVDIFSEAAFNAVRKEPSAIVGTVFRPSDRLETGIYAKYQKDTWCIALGGRFSTGRKVSLAGKSGFGSSVPRHSGNFTLEGLWYDYGKFKGTEYGGQIRLTFNYFLRLTPFISLDFRLSQRNRTAGERNRSELRSRFVWTDGIWNAAAVTDAVHCSDFAILGYAEGGRSSGKFSCHLRAGCFLIDNWEDRIYVYERDMPGNFNVPAFRGRGCWVSAYSSFKLSRLLKLYIRAGYTGYPFEKTPDGEQKNFRPGRTEVKAGVLLDIR